MTMTGIKVLIEFMDHRTALPNRGFSYPDRLIPFIPSRGDEISIDEEHFICEPDLNCEFGHYDSASFSPNDDGSYSVTLFVDMVWLKDDGSPL
jgi:hypothetical protein